MLTILVDIRSFLTVAQAGEVAMLTRSPERKSLFEKLKNNNIKAKVVLIASQNTNSISVLLEKEYLPFTNTQGLLKDLIELGKKYSMLVVEKIVEFEQDDKSLRFPSLEKLKTQLNDSKLTKDNLFVVLHDPKLQDSAKEISSHVFLSQREFGAFKLPDKYLICRDKSASGQKYHIYLDIDGTLKLPFDSKASRDGAVLNDILLKELKIFKDKNQNTTFSILTSRNKKAKDPELETMLKIIEKERGLKIEVRSNSHVGPEGKKIVHIKEDAVNDPTSIKFFFENSDFQIDACDETVTTIKIAIYGSFLPELLPELLKYASQASVNEGSQQYGKSNHLLLSGNPSGAASAASASATSTSLDAFVSKGVNFNC